MTDYDPTPFMSAPYDPIGWAGMRQRSMEDLTAVGQAGLERSQQDRHFTVTAAQQQQQLDEVGRHNQAAEQIDAANAETQRNAQKLMLEKFQQEQAEKAAAMVAGALASGDPADASAILDAMEGHFDMQYIDGQPAVVNAQPSPQGMPADPSMPAPAGGGPATGPTAQMPLPQQDATIAGAVADDYVHANHMLQTQEMKVAEPGPFARGVNADHELDLQDEARRRYHEIDANHLLTPAEKSTAKNLVNRNLFGIRSLSDAALDFDDAPPPPGTPVGQVQDHSTLIETIGAKAPALLETIAEPHRPNAAKRFVDGGGVFVNGVFVSADAVEKARGDKLVETYKPLLAMASSPEERRQLGSLLDVLADRKATDEAKGAAMKVFEQLQMNSRTENAAIAAQAGLGRGMRNDAFAQRRQTNQDIEDTARSFAADRKVQTKRDTAREMLAKVAIIENAAPQEAGLAVKELRELARRSMTAIEPRLTDEDATFFGKQGLVDQLLGFYGNYVEGDLDPKYKGAVIAGARLQAKRTLESLGADARDLVSQLRDGPGSYAPDKAEAERQIMRNLRLQFGDALGGLPGKDDEYGAAGLDLPYTPGARGAPKIPKKTSAKVRMPFGQPGKKK